MGKAFPFGQAIVWKPSEEQIKKSNMYHFYSGLGFQDYDSFYRKSIEEPGWFWEKVLQDLDIRFSRPFSKILDISDGIPFPKWCVDGRMNIVESCLDKWMATGSQKVALIYEDESLHSRSLTYQDIYDQTVSLANALKKLGVSPGDRIGLYMPMVPELLIAFLASIRIGGIVVPLFSGYGPDAILTRLRDGGVTVVFAADGFYRRGKWVSMVKPLMEALKHYSDVTHIIGHSVAGKSLPDTWISLSSLLEEQDQTPFVQMMSADDPLMIIYTSGTTGRPKGAVHSHCGFPVKSAQDMIHCMDVKQGDVMFWITDMGWMMGPWVVFGTMIAGATMVFYNGSPDYPKPDRLWELVEKHKITYLGVSPTLIRHLKPFGKEPIAAHNLSSLKALGSTGSPWDPESWLWAFEHILGGGKPILNYSGGTEISGGIVCGNFLRPLKPCAFSGPVPGMAADVVDEEGNSVKNAVGELVIRQPWIGMTRGFWKDHQRYLDTYWNTYEGIWRHGDYAAVDEDGLWYILGRSDDTIKVAGKRVGPAEVEAIANSLDNVVESAAIGVPDPVKGEKIILFIVAHKKWSQSDSEKLQKTIAQRLGKPLAPSKIYAVKGLPKTRNAKILRRLIKNAFLNQPLGDTSSLENPEVLKEFSGLHNTEGEE